jgi:tetratricopeptide (TPR) repeat protein
MTKQPSIEPIPQAEHQAPGDFYKHGWEQYVKGDYAEAEISFNRAVSLDSQYAEAYYGLGLTLKIQGNHQAAIDGFNKAINILQTESEQKSQIRGVMLRNLANAHIRMIQDNQNLEQSQ